jgi:hypothetical protein
VPIALHRRSLVVVVAALLGSSGCGHAPPTTTPSTATPRPVDADELVRALPPGLVDAHGWADDVLAAIVATGKAPTAERACAVVAVIGQESGFVADPPVRDLPGVVRRGLDDKLAPLGPLAPAARDAILALRPPGSAPDAPTFGARVARLRTERDLDRLFRDIVDAARRSSPGGALVAGALSTLLGRGDLRDWNPVTTAGSMQVKVDFARTLAPDLDDAGLREWLYTRGGGVRAGTARLLGYAAAYDDVVFRFADYNAGVYAARNAAVQAIASTLSGRPLARDGDLLLYGRDGQPRDDDSATLQALVALADRLGVSASTIRRDARLEKSAAWEQTKTAQALQRAWTQQTKQPAPYARVPDVALDSAKLTRPRTTAWFATSVKQRYTRCRAALGR